MSRNIEKRSLLFLISILFMVVNPINLYSQENIDDLRGKVRIGTGLAIGIGVTAVQGILLFGYTPQVEIIDKIIGLLATGAAAIPVSIITTNLFFDVYSRPEINQWASIPLGGLGGLIEGAIIGGVTYTVFFGLMEIINPGFMHETDNFWQAALNGLIGGVLFGALCGIIPGAIAAPCIRIFLPQQ